MTPGAEDQGKGDGKRVDLIEFFAINRGDRHPGPYSDKAKCRLEMIKGSQSVELPLSQKEVNQHGLNSLAFLSRIYKIRIAKTNSAYRQKIKTVEISSLKN